MDTDNNKKYSPEPELEMLVRQLAVNRANTSKWDINILVFLFAVLISVMILIALDIDMRIVAGVAIMGLVSVLFLTSRKAGKLIRRYYEEEIEHLQQIGVGQNIPQRRQLTPREREILNLVAQGYSNKMIGTMLGISVNTVKILISRVMSKLEAKDRTEAVVIAIKEKIISIN